MPIFLQLYGTSHCHLCEQAESLLEILAKDLDLQWSNIEIADDSTLLELYGLKIPALRRVDNNLEINWPFTLSEITQLIK